jgi:hypothetical protein
MFIGRSPLFSRTGGTAAASSIAGANSGLDVGLNLQTSSRRLNLEATRHRTTNVCGNERKKRPRGGNIFMRKKAGSSPGFRVCGLVAFVTSLAASFDVGLDSIKIWLLIRLCREIEASFDAALNLQAASHSLAVVH